MVKTGRTKVGSYGKSINYAYRCFKLVGRDLTRNRAKLHFLYSFLKARIYFFPLERFTPCTPHCPGDGKRGGGGGVQTYQIKIHIVKENYKTGSEHPPHLLKQNYLSDPLLLPVNCCFICINLWSIHEYNLKALTTCICFIVMWNIDLHRLI